MAEALLRLLTWFSPAFPTGGFAYSAGLEWAVEAGDVRNEATLITWLQDSIALGALWNDAILLRRAHRGEDIAERALALCPGAERRLETTAQGEAFALAAAHNIPEDDTVLAYLHNAVAGQISAAIRLIPLGQAAGLRAQAALEPAILVALRESKTAPLGGAAWRAEIAGMNHETQYTRLFRT
jgi:urease accessory protein